jgi:hypothetical protein
MTAFLLLEIMLQAPERGAVFFHFEEFIGSQAFEGLVSLLKTLSSILISRTPWCSKERIIQAS